MTLLVGRHLVIARRNDEAIQNTDKWIASGYCPRNDGMGLPRNNVKLTLIR